MLAEQLRQQMAAAQQLHSALAPQAPPPHFGAAHPSQYPALPQFPMGLPPGPGGAGGVLDSFHQSQPPLLSPLYGDNTLPAQDRRRMADQLRVHLRLQDQHQQQQQQHAQLQQKQQLEAQMQFEQQMLLQQQAAEAAGFQAQMMGGGGGGGFGLPPQGIGAWGGGEGNSWSVQSTVTAQASARMREQLRQQLLEQERQQQQAQALAAQVGLGPAALYQPSPAGISHFNPPGAVPQQYAAGTAHSDPGMLASSLLPRTCRCYTSLSAYCSVSA